MKAFSTKEISKSYRLLSDIEQLEVTTLITEKIRDQNGENGERDPRKTRRAIGRIFFAKKTKSGKRKAIHHLHVELWDKDIGNPDDFLGSGVTDLKGRFEIWYNPEDAGIMDVPDLEIRLFERKAKIDNQGIVSFSKTRIHAVFGKNDVRTRSFDFGDIDVHYWDYHPQRATPRVYIAEEGGPPQSYSAGRSMEMVKALSSIEVIKQSHILRTKIGPPITSEGVQSDYPKNLTRKLEENHIGITRSDEYFGDLFLNGMEASVMDKDPQNPDIYWIHHHWNSYEQDGVYAMPNVDIKFELRDDGLIPIQIGLDLRKKGDTKPNSPTEKIIITPKQKAKWPQAKRIARVSAALVAELDSHLCGTHLNAEQYAIAAYRNIRKNPIRLLLFPHLKEVALINHSADTLLLGETGYVTKATGFTDESLNKRIYQTVGTLDWKNWEPRKIISEKHIYAKAAWLFWDAMGEYVDTFFKEYEQGIVQNWIEIKLFSDELVENSVPAFLCNYLNGQLATPKNADWFDWNERMDTSIPRVEIEGELKSIQPVTKKKEPKDGDLENLKQMCRYVIYHTTFAHWWSNNRQYDEGGELAFTGLGLRYGDKGIFTHENDLSVLPPPREATMQLWISYMLSYTRFGLISKNEDKDLHPFLMEKIKALEEPYKEMGLDVHTMPSRTNI